MRSVRWGARIGALVLVLGFAAAPALAGGSVWRHPDTVSVGETVTVWAAVAWDHNPSLGTPDDGPFHAYLLARAGAYADDGSHGEIPPEAMWVAEIEVVEGPYDSGRGSYGPNHAIFELTVPDLASGEYWILHCNDPCTTPLGDITWGILTVGDAAQATTTLAADTTTTTVAITTSTTTTVATTTTTSTTTTATTPADADDADDLAAPVVRSTDAGPPGRSGAALVGLAILGLFGAAGAAAVRARSIA
ncbi:MAG: hypothetical protein AAGA90_04330 [Actinomycetota bacterium]